MVGPIIVTAMVSFCLGLVAGMFSELTLQLKKEFIKFLKREFKNSMNRMRGVK